MSGGSLQAGLECQWSSLLENIKHHQVEEVLQGQALSRSGRGGSLESMVTMRPLRLQDDYVHEERKFGSFRLALPQLEIKKYLGVLEDPLDVPLPLEPWQEQCLLLPIPRPTPTGSSKCILATGPTVSSGLSKVLLATEGAY